MRGNTYVSQLLVHGIVSYVFNRESDCFVSAQVFSYLVEICEASISAPVGPPDFALIADRNVRWIMRHAETMSGELEISLANRF